MPHDYDLGYVKCEPCMDANHDGCLGMDETEPFCGCRCPWLHNPALED